MSTTSTHPYHVSDRHWYELTVLFYSRYLFFFPLPLTILWTLTYAQLLLIALLVLPLCYFSLVSFSHFHINRAFFPIRLYRPFIRYESQLQGIPFREAWLLQDAETQLRDYISSIPEEHLNATMQLLMPNTGLHEQMEIIGKYYRPDAPHAKYAPMLTHVTGTYQNQNRVYFDTLRKLIGLDLKSRKRLIFIHKILEFSNPIHLSTEQP